MRSPLADRRILVLGGTSFVARHLCARLEGRCALAWTVRATAGAGGCPLVCDVRDRGAVLDAVARHSPTDVILAVGSTSTSDARVLYDTHVLGTLHVLEALAAHAPHALFVAFGSAAEYGDVPSDALPLPESYPTRPISVFGSSRVAQNQLVRAATGWLGLRAVVLRPFNVVGPGVPDCYLPGALIRRALEACRPGAGRIDVDNPEATRDFVHVGDLVTAVERILEDPPVMPGELEVFNVATGRETSVFEFAQHLQELVPGLTVVPGAKVGGRSGVRRSAGDASRLSQRTGWSPRVTWQESLAAAVDHARSGAR